MGRHRTTTVVPTVIVPSVDSDALYHIDTACKALGVSRMFLRTQYKSGKLRCAKHGGRYWFKGAWLMEWVEKAELKR
jgi:excisionase family DNA binding protein